LHLHRPPPTSTLFPYTTLFRSRNPHVSAGGATAESLRCFSGKSAVKGPLNVPGFRIKRLQHASQIVEISGRANNDVVANRQRRQDRKSTRLNSSHQIISYAVFC